MIETQIVTTKTQRRFVIEKDDTLYSQRLGGDNRGYQIGNVRRLRDLVPSPRHIIDVGANIGNNSIEYATWAEQVSSFEPTPHTRDWLEQNIQYNKANWTNQEGWYKTSDGWADMDPKAPITVYPYALSNKNYTTSIVHHEKNGGHNHLARQGHWVRSKESGVYDLWDDEYTSKTKKTQFDVEARTLDSFGFTEVDAIKIDVEGWELMVVEGGEQTILRDRPVIQTEIVENQCRKAGYHADDLVKWFHDRDYVRTMRDASVITDKNYVKIPKMMDSFWVPREQLKSTFLDLFEEISA